MSIDPNAIADVALLGVRRVDVRLAPDVANMGVPGLFEPRANVVGAERGRRARSAATDGAAATLGGRRRLVRKVHALKGRLVEDRRLLQAFTLLVVADRL